MDSAADSAGLPIDRPGKIVCVGLNDRDHAEEQGVELPEIEGLGALTNPGRRRLTR